MNEYLLIGLKTLLFLSIILIIIRIMGKRELGQLNVFDIIISFMISEIFSNAIADPNSNIFIALLPIFIIFTMQLLISIIVLKSKKIRQFIESKPTLIIDNGIIDYYQMKKQRYNISDLLQQTREQGIDNINEISYAVLENNGTLSVIKKKDAHFKLPFPLISDGEIDNFIKNKLQIDETWINNELKRLNIDSYKDVFIGFVNNNNQLVAFSKKLNNIK